MSSLGHLRNFFANSPALGTLLAEVMIGISQIGKCQNWLLSDHCKVFKNWLMSRLVNVITKSIGTCLIGWCLCFDWLISNWRIAIGKGLISGRRIGKWHSIALSSTLSAEENFVWQHCYFQTVLCVQTFMLPLLWRSKKSPNLSSKFMPQKI